MKYLSAKTDAFNFSTASAGIMTIAIELAFMA